MKLRHLLATAAAALTLASPAQALMVTSFTITSAIPDWLQIAEVQAWTTAMGANMALATNGGVATSGGVFTGGLSVPGYAIDGITAGNYPNIYHSSTNDGSAFLTVTLAAPTNIDTLVVYGRTDCCSARDMFNFQAFEGSKVVASGTLDAVNGTNSASFNLAVPEPATWAMMIAGFGMVGAGMRRRVRSTKIAFA
jgi:hypothetical protein